MLAEKGLGNKASLNQAHSRPRFWVGFFDSASSRMVSADLGKRQAQIEKAANIGLEKNSPECKVTIPGGVSYSL